MLIRLLGAFCPNTVDGTMVGAEIAAADMLFRKVRLFIAMSIILFYSSND
mgnify:CR=1 FL=1